MLLYKIKIFDKLGELVSVGSISNLATSSREHRIMPTSHPRSREFLLHYETIPYLIVQFQEAGVDVKNKFQSRR